MGDGVNIAALDRGDCQVSTDGLLEDAYRQVKGQLDSAPADSRPDPTQETSPS